MKKLSCIILVAALAMTVFATDATAQRKMQDTDYTEWHPNKGDWQLGFGVNPLTRYLGSLNNLGNDLDNFGGDPIRDTRTFSGSAVSPLVSVMGSYMVTDRLGIRFNVGFDYNSTRRRYEVDDQEALFQDPLSMDKVIDKATSQRLNLSVSGGVEYHVGKRSVQGVFGGGLVYGVNVMEKRSFTYGNSITEANQVPLISDDMPSYNTVAGYEYIPQARPLKSYADKGTHYIGVYGSVGVEWFVAPKVALGANVNVILDYAFQPSYMTKYEGWNVQTMKYEEFYKQDELLQDGFTFSTNNIGSNLYISFYF